MVVESLPFVDPELFSRVLFAAAVTLALFAILKETFFELVIALIFFLGSYELAQLWGSQYYIYLAFILVGVAATVKTVVVLIEISDNDEEYVATAILEYVFRRLGLRLQQQQGRDDT